MKAEKTHGARVARKRPLVHVSGNEAATSDRLIDSALRLWESEQAHIARRLAKLGVTRERATDWDFTGWVEPVAEGVL
jgi:hypothetical protein